MTATNINDELKERVERALDAMRPYLEADGGNVKVLEVTDEGLARLELLGSCGSCPMSAMTFKGGLEEAILRAVPEVKKVEAVNITAFA
ncbi:NifU family protein [Rudanella paleaurantiibacter]|uniref:NifU family protein n=1 Tax=Rudanella paleaurantiibacter TaxID=2614655 RepID=A0A7J5TTI8_9BACT|nr:NifU family protein [Rudanella paleaurantiibacter]KAB7727064.1 NifU family protein [Rudanella paleaurantiibacter]